MRKASETLDFAVSLPANRISATRNIATLCSSYAKNRYAYSAPKAAHTSRSLGALETLPRVGGAIVWEVCRCGIDFFTERWCVRDFVAWGVGQSLRATLVTRRRAPPSPCPLPPKGGRGFIEPVRLRSSPRRIADQSVHRHRAHAGRASRLSLMRRHDLCHKRLVSCRRASGHQLLR
jgi:hypothetical protein